MYFYSENIIQTLLFAAFALAAIGILWLIHNAIVFISLRTSENAIRKNDGYKHAITLMGKAKSVQAGITLLTSHHHHRHQPQSAYDEGIQLGISDHIDKCNKKLNKYYSQYGDFDYNENIDCFTSPQLSISFANPIKRL